MKTRPSDNMNTANRRLHEVRQHPIQRQNQSLTNIPGTRHTSLQSDKKNDNVATAYSHDKKKMLRLTIVQRRLSHENASTTPTSSVGSTSSQASTVNTGEDSSTALRDCLLSDDKLEIVDTSEEKVNDKTTQNTTVADQLTKTAPLVATEPPASIVLETNQGRYRLPKISLPLLPSEPKAAIHIESATNVFIQVITPSEKQTYLSLKHRLDESEHLWKSQECMLFPTYAELCHYVLHKDAKIAQDVANPAACYFIEPIPIGGSLHQYIQQYKAFPEADAQRIFRMIIVIIAFCHQLGIMIRDMKLRKLVFEDSDWQTIRLVAPLELKVCDDINDDSLTDRHGCPAYVSPEIVSLNATSYAGKPADMWSAGVLLYVILIGRYPFYDTAAARLFEKIRKAEFRLPNSLDASLDARIVIHSLLRLNPKKRPSALRLLRIAWMQPGAVQKMKALAPPIQIRRFCDSDDQVVPVINTAQQQSLIQDRLSHGNRINT